MKLIHELNYSNKIPIEHSREIDVPENEWQEVQFNYRLNICDDIFYMVINNEIIGHIGLSEQRIKTVYVKKEYRGQGMATAAYEQLFKIYEYIESDDAREDPAQHIWEKLLLKYPDKITYNKKKDIFIFNSKS